ncbi:hypothetical protein BWQ96_08183 [Gracilariopsis chorda]|uniref:N-acetylgalactosaminide beta-1,3-galactosyltransferase n=1 Tax=Gracilariopsis chorda TaxID=448386 RepID=A0A2V3IJ19_9FLOR|nr:hypothetical protein BWQ96_08183 [Gracilariopsis chorda]|eukprot:PXF42077.1 hypothetical protein BWQ96_08183 [Gracilariopsis chorda]
MFKAIPKRSRLVRLRAFVRRHLHRVPLKAKRIILGAACALTFLFLSLSLSRNLLLHAARGDFGPAVNGRYFDARFIRRANLLWRSEPRPEHQHELWNDIKYDVVIAVKTGHEVAAKRLKNLRERGWWRVGRHVPNFLVVSDADDDGVGAIGLKKYAMDIMRDFSGTSAPSHWFEKTGWRGDKDKNLPAVHLMRTMYPHKKWYLLLDDDTYIFLENFAKHVTTPNMNDGKPVYTGKVFYISKCGGFERDGTWAKNRSEPKGVFAHGGSGIVMNGLAVDSMYSAIPQCIKDYSSCWAGDMQVGLCLRRNGVQMRRISTPRSTGYARNFIPFSPTKAMSDRRYSRAWKSADHPLTFHKIEGREMELVSQLERLAVAANRTVDYTSLRVHLLKNGVVPDHSPKNKKNKHYSTEFMPAHLKR